MNVLRVGLIFLTFHQSVNAVSEEMVPVYTAAAALCGGTAAGCLCYCATPMSDLRRVKKSVLVGIGGAFVCGGITYLILSGRTPNARVERAEKILEELERDPLAAHSAAERDNFLSSIYSQFSYSEFSLCKAIDYLQNLMNQLSAVTHSINAMQKDLPSSEHQRGDKVKQRVNILMQHLLALKNIICAHPDYQTQRMWKTFSQNKDKHCHASCSHFHCHQGDEDPFFKRHKRRSQKHAW